jgi:hypothetical protein
VLFQAAETRAYGGGDADVSIDAPVSMYPAKKYCDITGLPVRFPRRPPCSHFSLVLTAPARPVPASLALAGPVLLYSLLPFWQ